MNVLLLEDEPDLSAVACEQIESRGHKVHAALNIAHAISILEDDSIEIDILIADHRLPDGDGAQFAIETKARPKEIKVVVVSGQLNSPEVKKLDANGIAYYDKPSLYADVVEDLIRKHFPDGAGGCECS